MRIRGMIRFFPDQCEAMCRVCQSEFSEKTGQCLNDKGHNVNRQAHVCYLRHEWR